MFHRGGTMESTPMSLHTDPGIVAQALVAIAHGSLRNIGYDPTVTTLQFNAHMNPRMIQVCIQLDNLDSKPHELALTIDTCLFSSHSVQGQGTHVFACIHPNYSQYLVTRETLDVDMEEGEGEGKKVVASYEGWFSHHIEWLLWCILQVADDSSRSYSFNCQRLLGGS
jgi:hypothetical protein